MNTTPNNAPGSSGVSLSAEALAKAGDHGYGKSSTQPFYWSVRRELWENRSLYLAPLIVAGVIVIGFMFSAVGLAERRQAVLLLNDPVKARTAIEMPYSMAAMMIMFTTFIVAVFYCLDALHGERRERSILFWKSLPVSDFTTVLSKAVVAFVAIPVITLAVVIVTDLMIFLISSVVLLVHGVSPATTLTHTHYFLNIVLFLYGIVVLTPCLDSLSQLTLGRYLTTPGLWIGLAVGIAFLAVAVRMRRYRGPM